MLKFCVGSDLEDKIEVSNKFRIFDFDKNKIIMMDCIDNVKNGCVQNCIDYTDKNGNEIYVGDILLNEDGFKMIVCLEPDNITPYCDGEREEDYFRGNSCKWDKYEIIGNIFDRSINFKFYEDHK